MSQMRLRQICLVSPHLEPVVDDLKAIMGLEVCHRDANVAAYGLENALLPVNTTLLEVVAPLAPGTAAGRFIEKSGGHGGYMAIFSCENPDERGRHAEGLGVRIAHVIDNPPYYGVQLHPRDCRAAFIEFNHTDGSDDIRGPYPPAGPFWQRSIRTDTTKALIAVELQSPQPDDLAAHWSHIIGVPLSKGARGDPRIALVNCNLHFVRGATEAMSGLTFHVGDVEAVRSAARARGRPCAGDAFLLGGVTFHVVG